MKHKKLPGLNGLRAIAASIVLIVHAYQLIGLFGDKRITPIYQRWDYAAIEMVNLFFVISGFIITYTLINEKKATGTTSIKNFYIKRCLRIWPLYFLILGIAYVISHATNMLYMFPVIDNKSLVFFTLFLVDFKAYLPIVLSIIPHYWSLSVEEQFYLIWPWLFKKAPMVSATVIIALFWFLRNGAAYLSHGKALGLDWGKVNKLLIDINLGGMALGCIGAMIVIKNSSRVMKYIHHPITQILTWGCFFYSVAFRVFIPYVNIEAHCLIYLILIINVTTNRKPFISLEQHFFEVTGKISYGIYMIHFPLILLIILSVKKSVEFSSLIFAFNCIPFVITCYAISFILAYISFNYFERFFLKLKPSVKPNIDLPVNLVKYK